jgi:transposase-like protein
MDDMNLVQLVQEFADETKCRAYLEALRWPEGLACPHCKGETISRIVKRNQFDCDSCRYQFSATAGTIFHDSHLPLWKWFLAVYLMVESKKGMSANQLKRTLKVSYKTAWYLCHRIRKAMAEIPLEPLKGIVEIDETYIGGKRRNVGRGYRDNKTMVLGAMQRGGHAHLRVERRTPTKKVLREFIEEQVGKNCDLQTRIMTDDFAAYRGAIRGPMHQSVNHSKYEWVRGDVHTNSVESAWSLFKRSVVGAYHKVSTKHLDAYLDEFEWRFNNRKNPYLFRDTMLKLIESPNLEYKTLTSAA